ncbi:MAG: MFS transporter [Clostridia bacterium]|nr:MFS transporter [Clostridia bacterium]
MSKNKTRLGARFWFSLVLFGLVGQIAWVVENMYLNVFIYKMFGASASDIAAMVAASAIAATLTTVLVGALADKIGKRKIFICFGYILWGISILGFALLRVDWISAALPAVASASALAVTLVIVLDCVMTFFGSSANDAAYNAWLTDSTDESNRGAAEGINSMMPLVAILAVFGGFMAFNLDMPQSWTAIFCIIGIAVTLIGVLGFFIIEEPRVEKSESGYFANVIYGFRPSSVKKHGKLYFYLICFVLFNTSIQIFMPYLIIYYEKSLGMTDYVFVMAPAILLASVVTALWGKVYDKRGFGFSSALALAWLCVGYVILFFVRATAPVFVGSLFMMCGYLSGMAVFGAKIRELTPEGKSGMLQGVRICAQVLLPGVIGPAIGKAVLANAQVIVNNDGTTSFIPNANIFLASLAPIVLLVIILLVSRAISGGKKPKTVDLPTDLDGGSWDEYPRPQMKRESYISLCGEWDLAVRYDSETVEKLGRINVPFAPESTLSGIKRPLGVAERYIYKKKFSLPSGFMKDRLLIHFGAVDQIAYVYLNGSFAGEHVGGYLPFELDLTTLLCEGENELVVEVEDTLDRELAYGKQTYKRGGMWYTAISGIWQSVWLESVYKSAIETIRITPDLVGVTVETTGGVAEKHISLKTPEGIREIDYEGDRVRIDVANAHLWTPEDPYLYEFTLTSGEDKIDSYFGLRTVGIEKRGEYSYICLNGKPYFFHGLLDQGYYSDGIYTPKTPEGYKFDILKMKELGFNMLRKHIKIEPELFYYYCDTYGMIVFQDMVNSGKYSFLIDTALPTVAMRSGITHKASARRREYFESSSRETIDLLYSHPCVCYYTIFNEGWGQYDADRIYAELKAYDPTRVYDATSGWFKGKESDVESEHIYFKKIKLKSRADRPLVLSEFGGYSMRVDGHSFNLDGAYGYKTLEDREALMDALEKLYIGEVLPEITKNALCATVLTQVSDVEDEINGLVTYDRAVVKVDGERMRKIAEKLKSEFEKIAILRLDNWRVLCYNSIVKTFSR